MAWKDWAKEQNLAAEPLTPGVPGPPPEAHDGVIWTLMALGSPTPPSMLLIAHMTFLLGWVHSASANSNILGSPLQLKLHLSSFR